MTYSITPPRPIPTPGREAPSTGAVCGEIARVVLVDLGLEQLDVGIGVALGRLVVADRGEAVVADAPVADDLPELRHRRPPADPAHRRLVALAPGGDADELGVVHRVVAE